MYKVIIPEVHPMIFNYLRKQVINHMSMLMYFEPELKKQLNGLEIRLVQFGKDTDLECNVRTLCLAFRDKRHFSGYTTPVGPQLDVDAYHAFLDDDTNCASVVEAPANARSIHIPVIEGIFYLLGLKVPKGYPIGGNVENLTYKPRAGDTGVIIK
jgi:hypothetical protein